MFGNRFRRHEQWQSGVISESCSSSTLPLEGSAAGWLPLFHQLYSPGCLSSYIDPWGKKVLLFPWDRETFESWFLNIEAPELAGRNERLVCIKFCLITDFINKIQPNQSKPIKSNESTALSTSNVDIILVGFLNCHVVMPVSCHHKQLWILFFTTPGISFTDFSGQNPLSTWAMLTLGTDLPFVFILFYTGLKLSW